MNSRKTIGRFGAVAVVVAALAGSLYAATTGSAAGTRAASSIVRTWDCRTDPVVVYGVHVGVQMWVTNKRVAIATGNPNSPENFVSLKSTRKGFSLGRRCHAVSKKVVMSRKNLVATHAALIECAAPTHVWIRMELGLDFHNGLPVTAKIEVTQPQAVLQPLGQVVWSRDSSTTYYWPPCATSG